MIPQDTDPLRDEDTDREAGERRGTLRICVPEDHALDGTWARWTAIADIRAGQPYTYSTVDFSVWLDWEPPTVGHRPYPGWSTPRPWYRRLAAWVRRGLR